MQPTTMLEYQKTILNKIGFSSSLLKREILKSIQWLTPQELLQLKSWIEFRFGSSWADLIRVQVIPNK